MRKSKKLIALLLTLIMALTFIPTNVARAITGNTTLTFNGPWVIGEISVSADKTGEVTLAPDAEINLTNFNSQTMEAVLHASDGFETTLTVNEQGKTSISTSTADGLPGDATIEFIVRAKNNGGGGGGNNNNESKIVFRNIDQIAFNEDTSTATITYKDAQEQDVTVTVAPALGTTLVKRAEQIYDGETPTDSYRDVLITNGGAVGISFTAEPLSANYTQFINGQPQTEQPVNFEITNNATSLETTTGSDYEVDINFGGNNGGGGNNNNEAKIVFRDISQIAFDEETSTATITYQNSQNQDETVTVTPAQDTTLTKRAEQQYDGETPLDVYKDVLITNGGVVNFTFSTAPQGASYNEFINGAPQSEQPVNFEITNNATSLETTIGSDYEVDINFGGNNGGGGPIPAGNTTAKITISGMNYNDSPTWTGTPGYGHEEITTYYDKYWYVAQFAINENGEHGDRTERWDLFSWEDNYSDEQFADAAERYGTQTITYDKEDGATTVDINVFCGNWGDRIDAIKINNVDYSDQLKVPGTDTSIFDDEASMLTLFRDQGIYFTITDVPVNEVDEDGIDEAYDIQIAASPNPKCYIGNFLWSIDDRYAPYEMGGTEPSDKYIGKSTLTLMDVYYFDGTFNREQVEEPDNLKQAEIEGGIDYKQLVDSDGNSYWYKHYEVPANKTEYTNPIMPAIHYELNRVGFPNGELNSEMVMPVGTWVQMKIQPEQGYQVESFSGVNRNAGNVRILSDDADEACIFMFKIDGGNFHIGANVVPRENTANLEETDAVSEANVSLETGAIDGGTAELAVSDVNLSQAQEASFVAAEALEGNDKTDFEVEACLDLSMNQVYEKGGVQDQGSDSAWRTEVGNNAAGLDKPATISLQLDDDIELAGKNVQVVHKNTHANNDTQTVYENVQVNEYDPVTNTISFDAESFSEYAIVAKTVEAPAGDKATIRVNTTTGVLTGSEAVFTYKDGEETVGTVKTSDAAAVEAEMVGNKAVASLMYVTGGTSATFNLEPVSDAYEPRVSTDGGAHWFDIQKNVQNKYVYTVDNLELNGEPADILFDFLCTRKYDVTFVVPTLTVGEGTEDEATASVSSVQGFNGTINANTEIEVGAKDTIIIDGFDSDRMVVRLTAIGDETGWAKVINPDEHGMVTLGVFDVPEESTGLAFSLIEKTENNQPGPNNGRENEAWLNFRDAVGIQMDEEGVVTVVYDNGDDEDIHVTVTAAEGVIDRVNISEWYNEQDGASGTNYELVTNGGDVNFAFDVEPQYAGYNEFVEGRPLYEDSVGLGIENNATTLGTEIGHEYEMLFDFGGNHGPDLAVVRFHEPINIQMNNTTGVVTVTYLDDNDNEVDILVTANNGVIDSVDIWGWDDEESGEHFSDYVLLSKGGPITIALPDAPEHTLACWSVVQNGEPSEPVGFDFDENNTTTLDTEMGKEYDVDISFRNEGPEPPHSDGTIKTNGIYCASNYPSIQAGISIEKSNPKDDVEYRWLAIDANNPVKWFEVSPWKLNNNWMSWTPEKSGSYVFVCYARVVGNEEASQIECAFGTEYHKALKGICQMPFDGGYLIGIESRDNPNHSYKYEMLVLDCNLLMQGDPNPWIYSTGKCGSTEKSLWTIWKPQYGYYWTLFRIYDANDNLIDEACYGFTNAN